MPSVLIIGGHGKVGLRLTRLLVKKPDYSVHCIIHKPGYAKDISELGAIPRVLSLEDHPMEAFSEEVKGKDLVYFTAGSIEYNSPERTRRVDYEGALKVFDAIEMTIGPKPRLIMVSSIDVRDKSKPPPEHYNEEDRRMSEWATAALGPYLQAKYKSDKDLSQRTAFKWTIVRPTELRESPGTGRATVGKSHLNTISRDDVALALALLAEKPDAAGLAIDLGGGKDEIGLALDAFIQRGESDFVA